MSRAEKLGHERLKRKRWIPSYLERDKGETSEQIGCEELKVCSQG